MRIKLLEIKLHSKIFIAHLNSVLGTTGDIKINETKSLSIQINEGKYLEDKLKRGFVKEGAFEVRH